MARSAFVEHTDRYEPDDPDPWGEDARRRDRRATVLRLLVTALVLGGAYVGVAWWSSTHLPNSVSVGGVQLGGRSPDEATATLTRATSGLLTTPIVLDVPGGDPVQVLPRDAGLRVDVDRSLDGLVGFSLDPTTIWSRLAGSVELPVLTSVDDDRLTAAVTALRPAVAVSPREGGITFPDGRVVVSLPASGRVLDVTATKLVVRRAFPDTTNAEAAVRAVPPRTSAATIQSVANGFATTAMSGPVTLVSGRARVELTPADLAPAVSVVADGRGGLTPKVDAKTVSALVASRLVVPTTRAVAARWTFEPGNGRPKVLPSTDGSAIDLEAATRAVVAAIGSPRRTVTVTPTRATPALTTLQAKASGVDSVVGEFVSVLPAGDATRRADAVRAARALNGTFVAPATTFSLGRALVGKVPVTGQEGASQVATVVYNLAWGAGAQLVSSSSRWSFDPRYPAGRESALTWPEGDVSFTNDSPHGMLLQVWVDGDRVHGRLWGTKRFDVRTVAGPRTAVVPSTVVTERGVGCRAQAGSPGFDITVTRQLVPAGAPAGTAPARTEPVTTHYEPQDTVRCES